MARLKAEKREVKRVKDKRRMASLADQIKRRKPALKTKKINVTGRKK